MVSPVSGREVLRIGILAPPWVPVPHPGSCSPQAWAAASVLLLLRANLGLDADVPGHKISLRPEGRLVRDISYDRLVIGGRYVSITVRDGRLIARADGLDVIDTRGESAG